MDCGVYLCSRCGRDTKSKTLLCRNCRNGKPSYVNFQGEQRGRSMRHLRALNDEEQDEETSESRYHGDNYET